MILKAFDKDIELKAWELYCGYVPNIKEDFTMFYNKLTKNRQPRSNKTQEEIIDDVNNIIKNLKTS